MNGFQTPFDFLQQLLQTRQLPQVNRPPSFTLNTPQPRPFGRQLRGQERQRQNTPRFKPIMMNGFSGLLPSRYEQDINEIGMQTPRRVRPQG